MDIQGKTPLIDFEGELKDLTKRVDEIGLFLNSAQEFYVSNFKRHVVKVVEILNRLNVFYNFFEDKRNEYNCLKLKVSSLQKIKSRDRFYEKQDEMSIELGITIRSLNVLNDFPYFDQLIGIQKMRIDSLIHFAQIKLKVVVKFPVRFPLD